MSHQNPITSFLKTVTNALSPEIRLEGDGSVQLLEALKKNNTKLVRALLELGAKIDESEYSVLSASIRQGNFPMMTLLLDHGADPNAFAARSNDSRPRCPTPLVQAILSGSFECAEHLLRHGADPSLKSYNCCVAQRESNKYSTPLAMVIVQTRCNVDHQELYHRLLALLVQYCNKPYEGLGCIRGWMFNDIKEHSIELVRALINKNAVNLLGNFFGDKIIDALISTGDLPLIECALSNFELEPELLFDHLTIGLRQALQTKNVAFAKLMIRRGAYFDMPASQDDYAFLLTVCPSEYINRADKKGNTLLHRLVNLGHLPLIELALERGANPNCLNLIGEPPFRQDKSYGLDLKSQYKAKVITLMRRHDDFARVLALSEVAALPKVPGNPNPQTELQIFQALPVDVQAIIISKCAMAPCYDRALSDYVEPSRAHAATTFKKLRNCELFLKEQAENFSRALQNINNQMDELNTEQKEILFEIFQEQVNQKLRFSITSYYVARRVKVLIFANNPLLFENIRTDKICELITVAHEEYSERTTGYAKNLTNEMIDLKDFYTLRTQQVHCIENATPWKYREDKKLRTACGFFTPFHGARAAALRNALEMAKNPKDALSILNHQICNYLDAQDKHSLKALQPT